MCVFGVYYVLVCMCVLVYVGACVLVCGVRVGVGMYWCACMLCVCWDVCVYLCLCVGGE